MNPLTDKMWVLDKASQERGEPKIVQKEVTYTPGLYKIFDEILVNAADNKVRDPKMDTIKIDINQETSEIKVRKTPETKSSPIYSFRNAPNSFPEQRNLKINKCAGL